jgi:hypothetical protein
VIVLWIGFIVASASAWAQEMTRITLLPEDRTLIGDRVVPTKDVVAELTKLHGTKAGKTMVIIRACPKAAGSFQGLAQALQNAKTFIVVDDNSGAPDAATCSR